MRPSRVSRCSAGIKAAGRSRRACTFAAGLWHPDDGRMIHQAEIVTVFVDPAAGAVPVPDDFWAAVEQMEGAASRSPSDRAKRLTRSFRWGRLSFSHPTRPSLLSRRADGVELHSVR